MRMKSFIVLAAAGLAVAGSSAYADFSRDITITAEYNATDNNGQPIFGAGGVPLVRNVARTLNLDTDFVSEGTDSLGTMWFRYTGDVRFGDLPTSANNPSLSGMQIGIREDPVVVANFNVAAGVVNTTFTVTSSLLSFPTIVDGVAIASAAISVTDSATFGDVGQVSITGLQPGGHAFAARFNGNSSTFANLILSGSQSIAPGGTHAFVGSTGVTYDAVPGSTFDMQSEFKFALSRFDRAAGTSTFEIIPAPGAAALIALGGLVATRRRRQA